MVQKLLSIPIKPIELIGIGTTLLGTGMELLIKINPSYNLLIRNLIPDYSGIICILTGIILISFTIFIKGVTFSKNLSPVLKAKFTYEFITNHKVLPNIDELFTVGDCVLQNLTHITKQMFEERLTKNRKIVRCILRRGNESDNLSGFYLLYPITKECQELISNGLIVSSIDFNINHITTHFINASSIYISIVFAKDRHSKAFILYLIMHDIRKILHKNKKISSIYVRPCTDDGHRLVDKYGFKLLPLSKTIYFIRTDKFLNKAL
jgi:hypothetical protein